MTCKDPGPLLINVNTEPQSPKIKAAQHISAWLTVQTYGAIEKEHLSSTPGPDGRFSWREPWIYIYIYSPITRALNNKAK